MARIFDALAEINITSQAFAAYNEFARRIAEALRAVPPVPPGQWSLAKPELTS